MLSLSIITINYNNKEGLYKTIQSVISQSFINIEYIIIDGGSTDDSLNVIKEFSDKVTYWVSEADNGIYHAMNKGIKRATGDYLLFLNSGDYLEKDILSTLQFDIFKEDIIYFNTVFVDNNSTYTHVYPDILTFHYLSTFSLPHQASLIKKELFDKYGLYNENLKICSDWAFFLITISKYNASYKHINKVFGYIDRNGISCDNNNLSIIKKEREEILQSHFSVFISDYEKFKKFEHEFNTLNKSFLFKVLKKFIK